MVLHIVNGDSTKELLTKAGLTEPVIVWREILCEGPCNPKVGSDQFWETRAQFIAEYVPGHSTQDYTTKVVKEIDRIQPYLKETEEIILWFEYDLFCQINLLACLTYLVKLNHSIPISLVLPEYKDDAPLKSLGHHKPDEILSLLSDRRSVPNKDLIVAKSLWKLWCAQSYTEMKDEVKHRTMTFPHLDQAIQSHVFYRTPNKNGTTRLQDYIKSLIPNPDMGKRSIIKACLTNETFQWLGFGDIQYEKIYESLV